MAVRHEVSFEQLVDYVEGRLGAATAGQVSEHLQAGCAECAEDVAWLRRTLSLMAADELVSAPPELVQRVQASYRPPERPATPVLAGLWGWLHKATWVPGRAQLRYAAAVALATVMILSGAWWGWGNTTVAQAATLAEVQGAVEVRLPGSDQWQPATEGMTVTAGSALRSGEGGTAVLLYADGSRTQLAEDAQIEILSLTGQRNGQSTTARLNLQAGLTQHKLIKSKSSVLVEAAGAVAEGHTGDYEVSVRDAEVEVHAGHGNVSLRVNGTTTNLGTGAHGRVKGGQVEITIPPRASPTERNQERDHEGDNGVRRGQQEEKGTPPGQASPNPGKGNPEKPEPSQPPGESKSQGTDPKQQPAKGNNSQPGPPEGRPQGVPPGQQ